MKDALWNVVSRVDGDLAALQRVLDDMDRWELAALAWMMSEAVQSLLEAWRHSGQVFDDEEQAFATAAGCVLAGQRVFEEALASQGPPDTVDTEDADLLWEVSDVYSDRYGAPVPSRESELDGVADTRFKPEKGAVLCAVGFYRELPHGDLDGPSLVSSMRGQPQRHTAELLGYLEGGTIYAEALRNAEDQLVPLRGEIGPLRILTDGVCVWPSDVAHYVRNYHIRLPSWFVNHARRAGFVPAGNVDVQGLELPEMRE